MTDSKPQITIRPRRPSDLPALAAIIRSVHAKFGYPVEPIDLTNDAETTSFICEPAWQSFVAEAVFPGPASTTPSAPQVIGHVAVTPFHRNAREDDWAAAGCTVENSGHVGRLFVSPEAHGLGAGKALMKAVMDYAVEKGKRLCIYVVTKDVAATKLYERLGWRRIGMETYQGWDNWMYVWHGWAEAEKGAEEVKG